MVKNLGPSPDTKDFRPPGVRLVLLALIAVAVWALLPMFGIGHVGSRLEEGTSIQDFSFSGIPSGKELRLSSLRGKPVVLTFFSTSCPACKRGLPALDELSKTVQGKVSFLVVSDEDPKLLAEYWRSLGLSLPLYLDSSNASSALRVDGYPYTVVLDSRGLVHADFLGKVKASDLPES